jgi:hypothetical protein
MLARRLEQLLKSTPPICESVKYWAKDQPESRARVLFENLIEPQVIKRTAPLTIEPELYSEFIALASNHSPEKYLVQLSQVRLIGHNGILILPDGRYTAEMAMTSTRLEKLPEYYSSIRHQLFKRRTLTGEYYSLLHLHASTGNYYHWMHDALQKLYLVLERLPSSVKFIVPSSLKAWQLEALEAIGLSQQQLLAYPGREIWEIETLYFSPLTAILGFDSPEANEWVRSCFYKRYNIQENTIEQNRHILISRELAQGRKIANESEVEAYLSHYGFEKYCLETLSLEEQVRLFASAKVIVSPHGAGLTNLMFSQPGTRVLETFEPTYISSLCFWSICNAMGHVYSYCLGETVANPDKPNQHNIRLPIEKLSLALEQLLAIT